MSKLISKVLFVVMSFICTAAIAATPPAGYTFVVPPRQSPEVAEAVYGKIAHFLTSATGTPITLHYISNWLTYMEYVQKNKADLYFDGPSFIGWRIARWHANAIVALAGGLDFALVDRKDHAPISNIQDLAGAAVCAFSPPNLATLTLDSWFPNPERRPYIVVIHNFKEGAQKIIQKKCEAILEPQPVFKRLNKLFPGELQIAYRAAPIPNQGFSVSARVPEALREKITAALLSPAGAVATKPLRDLFGHKPLVLVHNKDYLPYRKLLDIMVGF